MAAQSKTPVKTEEWRRGRDLALERRRGRCLPRAREVHDAGDGPGRGRLIFAMDATMSRQPTWDMALKLQADMFSAVKEVGGLDVQLVYFRGLDETRASKWVGDPEALARLMTSVSCQGGYTQIRKVLTHARRESEQAKVNAVVYVGDCMEEDIDELCARAGELALLGVPMFLFQEGREPKAERDLQGDRPSDARRLLPFRRRLRQAASRAVGGGRGLRHGRPQGAPRSWRGDQERRRGAASRTARLTHRPMPAFLAGLAALLILVFGGAPARLGESARRLPPSCARRPALRSCLSPPS